MNLRSRLLASYMVFVIALASVGAWSAWHMHEMGETMRHITGFVRKPMTPEILRNALVAALAKSASPPAGAAGSAAEPAFEHPYPSATRLTFINGFRSWHAPELAGAPLLPNERCFMVQHPDGWQEKVLVEIDGAAPEYVEREAGRLIPIEDPFWTSQAAHTLNAFLWDRGRIPPGGKLTVDAKGIDSDVLHMAERWGDKYARES